jgi:hypothetical protein
MRVRLSAVFLLLFISVVQAQKKKIKIAITWKEPYCGGARPTEEMQLEAGREKPYAGKILIIESGKKKIDSVSTDSGGMATFKLKRGSYRVLEPWRYYRSTPDGSDAGNYNEACLKQEWNREFMLIKISFKKTIIEKKMPLVRHCPWQMPCLNEGAGGHVPD